LKILAQKHDYVVVDGPVGALDLAPVAAALSVGSEALHPVGALDPEIGGIQPPR
jgi:hypothetical protein